MPLLVVRHAPAGKREDWAGDDRLRPLDERGWRQAESLPQLFERFPIDRITSSSYVRCTQTVEALAEARGVGIEARLELEEDAAPEQSLALLAELGDAAVLCTHGDVLENVFGKKGQKGSTRVVELRGREPVVLEYLAPPA
jgi:phosphohistidine phosphatase SixA